MNHIQLSCELDCFVVFVRKRLFISLLSCQYYLAQVIFSHVLDPLALNSLTDIDLLFFSVFALSSHTDSSSLLCNFSDYVIM